MNDSEKWTRGDSIFALLFLGLIVMVAGFPVAIAMNFMYPLGYREQGTVTILREYEGHGSPYAILEVTTNSGRTFNFTVQCNYYETGNQVEITGYTETWFWFWVRQPTYSSANAMITNRAVGC